MQTLKFLGRGSAFNTVEGNTSAYIKQDDRLFLIDCGETVFKRIRELNLIDKDTKSVYVLITHLHGDHIGSLSTFIFWCYFTFNIVVTVIYPDVEEINGFLEKQGVVKKVHCNIVDGHYACIKSLNLFIEAKKTKHYNMYRDKKTSEIILKKSDDKDVENYQEIFKSYGYEILFNSKNIFYSGDTSRFNVDIKKFDEIYHDCSSYNDDEYPHIGINKLADKINIEDRKKVYLMHFSDNELIKEASKLNFNIVNVE